MWPDAAQRLPTSAPNLAPRQLVSAANVRSPDQSAAHNPPPGRHGGAPARTSRQPSLRHELSYPGTVRQLIVTGLGRDAPTVIIIITNDTAIKTRALIS